MSVILHGRVPGLPAAAAGLAVRDAVSALVDAECGLKWPNDVEIEGRKCAGILVEAVKGAKSPCYVVGIGINVSVDFSAAGPGAAEETAAGPQAAEETAAGPHGAEGGAAGPGGSEEAAGDVRLGSTATSVCEYRDCNAAPVDRAALIRQVADNLSEYSGSTALLDLFRSALTTLGKDVRVSTGAEVVEGRAVDVDEVGRLLVREPGGSTHRLSAGDVSLSVR
jgi:BirA family biotin operon repressor/biotin-[acetyl-CoA-carboxylase] ligase